MTDTITDSRGRVTKIPEKIERAIVLNSNCWNMLKIIGAEGTVIGVTDTSLEALGKGVENFGSWQKPNVEKILAARPGIVFTYGNLMASESLRQMEDSGITLVCLDFYKPSGINREILALGKLYHREKAAQEYVDFLDGWTSIIVERLADIPLSRRVKVYWEHYRDYISVGPGSGGHELIEAAFCVNLTGNEAAENPKISDEWILTANPGLIIKASSVTAGILGTDITDKAPAIAEYQRLKNRPGWSELQAVQNGKLLLLSSDITTSPEGSVIGPLLIAKAAYPERFTDIDPIAVYADMLRRFFGREQFSGVVVHP
jgi:iron complex transport system substrate-binding protein